MKIGMILDTQFPPDMRVENEARSLTRNGHDVYLLSLTYSPALPLYEEWSGVKVIRMPLAKKLAKKGRGLINTALDLYTPYWARKIKEFISSHQLDVLHVHDLFMLGAAFRAANSFSLPIIADLHENYVEGLKYYRFANTFPGNLLISINKWSKTEIKWCRQADHIITVIDEAVERYAGLGIDRKKLNVVANYVKVEDFLNVPDIPDIINRLKVNFSVTYIGGFDTHRGLESTIYAAAAVCKQVADFKLVLVGHGNNSESLKDLAIRLQVADHVSFEGYRNPETIPSYIKASSVCLIPHLKTVHTDNTIPHKLFHYMLLGKPVVASNCAPIERIVNDSQCGLIYHENNPQDLADKIIQLYKDKATVLSMGKNGRTAVLSEYNWQIAEKKLLQLYNKISKLL